MVNWCYYLYFVNNNLKIFLFYRLSGSFPFYGDSDEAIMKKIILGDYSFNSEKWQNISNDGK